MSAPLPPGHTRWPLGYVANQGNQLVSGDTRPASPQPGERDERRRICAHPTGMTCRCFEPAPSAGQDTERLRDEVARTARRAWFQSRATTDVGLWRDAANALVHGPLRQLIAERDEARGQVQRVRAWVASMDDLARQYADAAASVSAPDLVAEAREHADDIAASAEGVRRALDGPA